MNIAENLGPLDDDYTELHAKLRKQRGENLKSRERFGMAGYVRFLACLPGTPTDIGAKLGVNSRTAQKLMLELRILGLVAHQGFKHEGRAKSKVFALGCEHRPDVKCTPRAQVIAFASVYKAMRNPKSVREIHEETGVYLSTIRRIIDALRTHRMCRIAEWEPRHGCPIALHQICGPLGKDCKRPEAMTRKEINAKQNKRQYRRRAMQRLIQITAGMASNDAQREAA